MGRKGWSLGLRAALTCEEKHGLSKASLGKGLGTRTIYMPRSPCDRKGPCGMFDGHGHPCGRANHQARYRRKKDTIKSAQSGPAKLTGDEGRLRRQDHASGDVEGEGAGE